MNKRVILHQFEFSNFNEKIRWALDYKAIVHERISYLPGPHMSAIKKLSGKTETPVLDLGGDIVSGSAAIIDRLEERRPRPNLYPSSQTDRVEALAYQTQFDAELGPASRTVIFSKLINEQRYLCAMFARQTTAPKRLLYRMCLPFARGLIAKANGTTDPANVARSEEIVEKTLDEIAHRTKASGYLVGDCFSVADLTAAALLAGLANPQHADTALPLPMPDSIAALIARYAGHPAILWVTRMYEQHR